MTMKKEEWIARVKEEIDKTRKEIKLLEEKKKSNPYVFSPIENMRLKSLYDALNELKSKLRGAIR